VIDYKKDIAVTSAKRWPTTLSLAQFAKVTQLDQYPDYLKKDVKDNNLQVYANGEMNYTLNGVAVKSPRYGILKHQQAAGIHIIRLLKAVIATW
jgi:hypothetical protein